MHSKDTHTALPIYMQISESLMRDIASGRYVEGERLPPERSLAATYKTTVRTLRKSLAELEKNGMLERVQGSGNYVRYNADARSIYSMFRLELPTGGGLPSADILTVEYSEKPADLPDFGTSKHASMIRRLRYLDDIVIAVEEIWLDGDSGRVGPRAALRFPLSLLSKEARILGVPRGRFRLDQPYARLGSCKIRHPTRQHRGLYRAVELGAKSRPCRVFPHMV